MKPFIFFILYIIFQLNCVAQNHLEYNVTTIPDSLKVNANSVVREENIKLVVNDGGKTMLYTKKAITVLNIEGDDALLFIDYEDDFRKLTDANITVYNTLGYSMNHYTKKQLEKVRGDDGFSLVNDYKLYYFKVPANQYPITVVFESEVTMKSYLDFDDIKIKRENQSIQELSYAIQTSIQNPIKYKNFDCTYLPTIVNDQKTTNYNWNIKNEKAIRSEKNSSAQNTLPRIAITPTFFEMDGYKGEFTNWQTYGKWYYSLCNNSNDFSEKEKNNILALVANQKSDKEKIKILYNYLQQNYRYVSIQLGIGGFKPFSSAFVSKNKYGDCKALSNYMQSMLSVVGINSYQALINAGTKQLPVDVAFPNHSFNHVILCVPNKGDTVWLECTSSTMPFAKLGSFTENRNALLITPNGGVLVATPKSIAQDNIFETNSIININDDLSAIAKTTFKHTGVFKDIYINDFSNETKEVQNKFLLREVGFKPFEKVNIHFVKEPTNQATNFEMDYNKIYDFNAGDKYFIRQHLFTIWDNPLPMNNNRITDYFFQFPFVQKTTTTYILPKGFTMDNIPKPIQLNCNDAIFSNEVKYSNENNSIVIITNLVLVNQKINAVKYAETKAFFDNVISQCNQKIVIKKN